MGGKIDIESFKQLCHLIDELLTQVEGDTTKLQGQLTEILMAQDFQDLTGQVIRRVIELVQEVEKQLVEILTAFGLDEDQQQETEQQAGIEAEGPVVNEQQRQEKQVMQSQDDVDDLLSSLGF